MMKFDSQKVILNLRGIIAVFLLILMTGFVAGFVVCREIGNDGTTFSRDELERIVQLQSIEDETGSGANVVAYKDKDGHLMIGWELNKSRK